MKVVNEWNSLYNRIFQFCDVDREGNVYSKRNGEKLKKGRPNKKGYLRKNFHIDKKNGKPVTIFIHRLVAYKYLKNDDPKKVTTVDHINKDKNNNSVDNLQWMTQRDNVRKG